MVGPILHSFTWVSGTSTIYIAMMVTLELPLWQGKWYAPWPTHQLFYIYRDAIDMGLILPNSAKIGNLGNIHQSLVTVDSFVYIFFFSFTGQCRKKDIKLFCSLWKGGKVLTVTTMCNAAPTWLLFSSLVWYKLLLAFCHWWQILTPAQLEWPANNSFPFAFV